MSAPTSHQPGDHPHLAPPETVEVADGVYAYVQPDGSWWINNTGFLVGRRGVTAIDSTSTERRTEALLAAIGAVTSAPIQTMVNTHHHGDHTNGNCLFTEATIIGHTNCRDNMKDQRIGGLDAQFGGVDWGDLSVAAPTLTFEQRIDLHVDELAVELHYIGGPAHTTGDVVAWIPDRGVLFAGDLVFNGGTPFVLMGSVAGSLAALERIRWKSNKVAHQHGNIAGAIAQRRREDGKHLQPVIEVGAELFFRHHLGQVAIGGGNQPHVHLDRPRSAEPLEFALLQGAQQLGLQVERHLADFVQKQRALVAPVRAGPSCARWRR